MDQFDLIKNANCGQGPIDAWALPGVTELRLPNKQFPFLGYMPRRLEFEFPQFYFPAKMS